MCQLTAYSDESGSFNPRENGVFVLAGFLFPNQTSVNKAEADYLSCESCVRNELNLPADQEIKAYGLPEGAQSALLEFFKEYRKFAVVIYQNRLDHFLINASKARQRYLDHMYALGFGKCIKQLIDNYELPNSAEYHIQLFHDKHRTATYEEYELAQYVESYLKFGTTATNWYRLYKPIFPALHRVDMKMLVSEQNPLIRLADMLANRIFRIESGLLPLEDFPNLTVFRCSADDLEDALRHTPMRQTIRFKIPLTANSPIYTPAI